MQHKETFSFSQGFKGLPDGWKDINTVTFVVGENSTGKTSLFDLLSIIDKNEFALTSQILELVEGATHPSDVISRIGKHKDLTIGYLYKSFSQETPGYTGLLVTVKSFGNELSPTNVTIIDGNTAYRVKKKGRTLLGKLFPAPKKDVSTKLACRLAENAHFSTEAGYSKIFSEPGNGPVGFNQWFTAKMLAAQEIRKHNTNGEKPDRSMPSFLDGPGLEILRYGPIRKESVRITSSNKKPKFDQLGSHYPHLIKRLFDESSSNLDAVRKFGRESGLFDDIRVVPLRGDRTEAFSILYKKYDQEFHVDELGYGLGQVIPIVTDLLLSDPDQTFLLQQPEVHLHPRAQAAFGELLHAISKGGCTIVVETHSDFLIDRFRLSQAKSDQKVESQILFFEKSKSKEQTEFSSIKIEDNGQLKSPPESYRDFFINESIAIFEHL